MTTKTLTRTCPKCGAEFTTTKHTQKYCDNCKTKSTYKKRERVVRICPSCGCTYTPRSSVQKFCDGCREHVKAKKTLRKSICPVCNREFTYKVKNGGQQKYCDDCKANRKADVSRMMQGITKPRKMEMEIECRLCGQPFYPTNNNQVYCHACKANRKPEIQALQKKIRERLKRNIEEVERPDSIKLFPSVEDILRKAEDWCDKNGDTYMKPYDYGRYVYLQSIGRVP